MKCHIQPGTDYKLSDTYKQVQLSLKEPFLVLNGLFPFAEKGCSQFVSLLCLLKHPHSTRAGMKMCDVKFGPQVTCFSGNAQIIQDRVMGWITG